MIKRYEHTQVGYLIIVVMAAVMVMIGIILAKAGINYTAIAVLIFIAVALVVFSSLTVVIWEEELSRSGAGRECAHRFGLGAVPKILSLHFYTSDILDYFRYQVLSSRGLLRSIPRVKPRSLGHDSVKR